MKYLTLQETLNNYTGENVNLTSELETGLEDMVVSYHLGIKNNVDLWYCTDDDNTAIVRYDNTGFSLVFLYSSRSDELTLAAWNVDFDIRILKPWIGEDLLGSALDDASENSCGFEGNKNKWNN